MLIGCSGFSNNADIAANRAIMPSTKSREKLEIELSEHVKKALSTTETAPKQKHVRSCIVFSWDHQSSAAVWNTLQSLPVMTDQVVCYKSLIMLHKMLVGGPHVVLGEALGHRAYFEGCLRVHGAVTLGFGYGPLIQAYVEFLLAKLEFHRTHAEFTGNFDYEEYISLKGVSNLDEGYQTIGELMDLQERVDRFQRTVFINVRPMAQNECRIASLVPLVEESYGIYKFITSMLSAMHLCVESADPLMPLVERYNSQFHALKKFYGECNTIRYLTSLIEIPRLPDQPPTFDLGGPERPKPKPEPEPKKEKSPLENRVPSADLLGEFDSETTASELDIRSRSGSGMEQMSQFTHTVTTVPVVDQQTMQALQQAQMQIATLQEQLQQVLFRHQQDQGLIQQYDEQLLAARQQQESMSGMASQGYGEQVRMLQEELEQWKIKYEAMSKEAAKWKAKYEGMAALYQQLRTEHVEALTKLRDLQKERDNDAEERARREATEKASAAEMAGTLGDRLAAEMLRVTQAIDAAAARLENMRTDPALARLSGLNSAVHAAIVDGAATITTAIGNLIKYAIQTQAEIVAAGKGSGTPDAFYKRHSEWTNGLISAAQTVAAATMTLVETADGVLKGTHKMQHLVAASNAVAAATMQLVTASRVKADLSSVAQPLLERAAKAVTDANRRLVDSATNAVSPTVGPTSTLPTEPFALKVEELERQARVLALEQELTLARTDLATLRKAAYSSGAANGGSNGASNGANGANGTNGANGANGSNGASNYTVDEIIDVDDVDSDEQEECIL
ncbi:hypothetical protein PSACC_00165 [Paramicrosporidium saccamoebae]|uniref:Uncharacterized protein n=1 Tax=Paramicrosporidium saccamoebae TaxID=1246581 RepID=A0A2H9TQN3_9FUNG|nr:hypothetical protein PSACC_00165 [Paramicrosporidium saccamoebae]